MFRVVARIVVGWNRTTSGGLAAKPTFATGPSEATSSTVNAVPPWDRTRTSGFQPARRPTRKGWYGRRGPHEAGAAPLRAPRRSSLRLSESRHVAAAPPEVALLGRGRAVSVAQQYRPGFEPDLTGQSRPPAVGRVGSSQYSGDLVRDGEVTAPSGHDGGRDQPARRAGAAGMEDGAARGCGRVRGGERTAEKKGLLSLGLAPQRRENSSYVGRTPGVVSLLMRQLPSKPTPALRPCHRTAAARATCPAGANLCPTHDEVREEAR
jgi:hypothetical protein